MTDMDKGQTSGGQLEEVKREAKEDASAYYAQGDSEEEEHSAANYHKPVESVDPSKEELSFLKTVAFLGFGLATLAIVFILFFVRDLDERVVSTDKKVESTASTIAKLDGEIAPFKQEVNDKIQKISADVDRLQGKIGDHERMMAVMELKRAMVTIQEVMGDSNPKVQSKTGMVVSSIHSLLGELDAKQPASEPVAAIPDEMKPVLGEEAPVDGATEELATDEDENGEKAEEESGDEEDEEHADIGTVPAIATVDEASVGEIQLSEGEGEEGSEDIDELPPIDDLLTDE